MSRVAALLRGVNVGGRARVPMGDLRVALTGAGLAEVETLLQSGNVVFEAGAGDDARLVREIIAREFGIEVTVIMRTARQLRSIASKHPTATPDANGSLFHVTFLESKPSAKAVAGLEPERFEPDRFSVAGKEVYVSYPNGQGRSKLTLDYFERALGVKGTMRNLNTVNKLAELTGGRPQFRPASPRS